MLVSIGSYAICDGTLANGVAIGQLRFGVDRQIEIVVPIGIADPELYDRGGRKTSITFTVQRTHASAGSAELFIASLDSSLPSTGDVTLEFTTTGTEWLIPKGKVINHSSTQIGATTNTTYTIIGGGAVAGSGSGPVFDKVMLTDSSTDADSYVEKDWGSDIAEVWVTFYISFSNATLVTWAGTGGPSWLARIVDTTPATTGFLSAGYDPPLFWQTNSSPAGSPAQSYTPSMVGSTWFKIELHIEGSTNKCSLIINGVPIVSVDATGTTLSRKLRLGQQGETTGAENLVYYAGVKVGTTQGGTDIFADDFSGGDLSNWDSTSGTCSVISDPF